MTRLGDFYNFLARNCSPNMLVTFWAISDKYYVKSVWLIFGQLLGEIIICSSSGHTDWRISACLLICSLGRLINKGQNIWSGLYFH